MKVQFTPSARLQFLAAIAYILQDNPPAAVRFRKKAEALLRRLEKFPELGRVIPEFPELPYREVIVTPYRFFYRVEGRSFGLWPPGVVHCFRVCPPARKIGNPFPVVASNLRASIARARMDKPRPHRGGGSDR